MHRKYKSSEHFDIEYDDLVDYIKQTEANKKYEKY